MNKIQKSNGVGLIELLIAISVVTIGLVYLLGMFSFSIRIMNSEKKLTQANFIAQGNMEGVRNFRDETSWGIDGLGTIVTSTIYHLEKSGSPEKWSLISDGKTIDGFTQEIVFDDVRRDLNKNIIENGGSPDSNTKKVTVTVSWQEREESKEVELIGFFTNWN